MTQFIVLGLGE